MRLVSKKAFVSVDLPMDIWDEVYPIVSFIVGFPPGTEFEYKVWPKGTPEPDLIPPEVDENPTYVWED